MPNVLRLKVLPGRYAVCRLDAHARIPERVLEEPFFSLMRTDEELSLILPEDRADPQWQVEPGWRIFKVEGPLEFSLVGVLAQLANPLAESHISIFVSSTYDTDYVMVKAAMLGQAVAVLRASGFDISWME